MTYDLLKRAVKQQKAASGGELWKELSQGKASLPSTAPQHDGLEAKLNAQGTPRVRVGGARKEQGGDRQGTAGASYRTSQLPWSALKNKKTKPLRNGILQRENPSLVSLKNKRKHVI